MPDTSLRGSQKLTSTASTCFTAEQRAAGWTKHALLFGDGIWVVPALRLVRVMLPRAQHRVTGATRHVTPGP